MSEKNKTSLLREMKLLSLLELRGLYGWNRFRCTKDKKEKRRYMTLLFAWMLVGGMAIFYTGMMSYGLIMMGLSELVPSYLVMLAGLIVLAFGIFKAGQVIFSKKGYDFLSSLPVRSSSIVVSRFMELYVEDFILTCIIVLPGTLIYGVLVKPEIWFYLIMYVGVFFVPLLPLVASVIIGTIVTAISSRMKHKNLVQTLLILIFVLGGVFIPMGIGENAEDLSMEIVLSLAERADLMIQSMYPPAAWLKNAAVHGRWDLFLLFILVSAAAVVIMILVVAYKFHQISRRIFAVSATHDYQMKTLKSKGMLFALYRREMKRYFSSSIYVTNTIVGPILAAAMTIALLVTGVDTLQKTLMLPIDLERLMPFVFSGVFCMMTTTSVSISMEGKQFWIVKTLPVPTKMLLDSKILLNLSLMLPFYMISEVCLILALKTDLIEAVWLILIPAVIIVFSVVVGISVNLKLHRFDWEKEEAVVKQSASAMLGGMAGLFISFVCGVLVAVLPSAWSDAVRAGNVVLLGIVTLLLYRSNNRIELKKL